MKPRLLLAVVALALTGPAAMRAEEPAPAPTSTSNLYSEVTCSTNDDLACADTLQLAADTRDSLASILRLGPHWRFPVHIHIVTPDDPLAGKIDREGVRVLVENGTLVIDAYVPAGDPDAREFIQRQYVTALLWERFFADTTKFDANTQLDIVPLWLVEGLREWLNEDPAHNREAIARRALQLQTEPSLAEITGWKKLSDDRLLGLWQRAFSFYLVASMLRNDDRRADFQQWLDSFAHPENAGHLHFPTEANWQRELADSAARGRNTVYTWQETADEFSSDATIIYAESKNAKVKTCTIDEVAGKELSPALRQAIHERLNVLTALELRAHPAWHSVLETYRTGLTLVLSEDEADRAPRVLAMARALRQAQLASHQKLVDYLNWFEVTRDFGVTTTRFRVYFATARQMEQAVADPTHPNPIREDLLQVESRL